MTMQTPYTAKAGDQHSGPLFDAITGYLFDYEVPVMRSNNSEEQTYETIKAGFGVDGDGILAMVNGLSRLTAAVGAQGQEFNAIDLDHSEDAASSFPCITFIDLQQGVSMRADAIVKAVSPSVVLQWLGVSKLVPPAPPSNAI